MKYILSIGILVLFLVLLGCAQEEAVDETDDFLAELEDEETALAGQAIAGKADKCKTYRVTSCTDNGDSITIKAGRKSKDYAKEFCSASGGGKAYEYRCRGSNVFERCFQRCENGCEGNSCASLRCLENRDCVSGLCGWTGDYRVCSEIGSEPVGSFCIKHRECASGLCGRGEDRQGVCSDPRVDPVGERCNEDRECESSLCDTSVRFTCLPVGNLSLGQSCDSPFLCESGHCTFYEQDDRRRVCSELFPLPLGTPCGRSVECQSALCAREEDGRGECSEWGLDPLGALCWRDDECASDFCGQNEGGELVCLETRVKAVGASCVASRECVSYDCSEGFCT